MTSRNGISAQRDASYHCCRAFLSSFARSLPPKRRPQKPRFFLGCSSVRGGGGGGVVAACVTTAGGLAGSMCTGDGFSVDANTLATAPVKPPIGCRSHNAVGSVPRAKNSVYTIERFETSPWSSTTTAWLQPSLGSFPDSLQTLAATMPA